MCGGGYKKAVDQGSRVKCIHIFLIISQCLHSQSSNNLALLFLKHDLQQPTNKEFKENKNDVYLQLLC